MRVNAGQACAELARNETHIYVKISATYDYGESTTYEKVFAPANAVKTDLSDALFSLKKDAVISGPCAAAETTKQQDPNDSAQENRKQPPADDYVEPHPENRKHGATLTPASNAKSFYAETAVATNVLFHAKTYGRKNVLYTAFFAGADANGDYDPEANSETVADEGAYANQLLQNGQRPPDKTKPALTDEPSPLAKKKPPNPPHASV